MTTFVLQGARKAAPYIINAAGRVALSYANAAISNAFDRRVFEGPRLESLHIQTSRDGAPMPRLFGRTRIAGQVIWASNFKETSTTTQSGGKGGGPKTRNYSYTISFAVGRHFAAQPISFLKIFPSMITARACRKLTRKFCALRRALMTPRVWKI